VARTHLRHVVQDASGNVLTGTSVNVYKVGTTSNITDTMYDARAGGTAISNPLTSNAQGEIEAWIEVPGTDIPGFVDLKVNSASAFTETVELRASPLDGPRWFNVRAYGALGDGTTDDTATIQDTANGANGISGAVVFLPSGVYICASRFTWDLFNGITLQGSGKNNTEIRFTGAGATSFISWKGATNVTIRDLKITYNSGSFTGALLDFSKSGSTAAGFISIENCRLQGVQTTANAARALIDFEGGVQLACRSVRFYDADLGISGTGSTDTAVSNAVTLEDCWFQRMGTAATKNPKICWTFVGCIFEPLISGPPGKAMTFDANGSGLGITFTGCYWGDQTVAGPATDWNGSGLTIQGGSVSLAQTGDSIVRWTTGSSTVRAGVSIMGMRITAGAGGASIINSNALSSRNIAVLGNAETSGNPLTLLESGATKPLGFVWQNPGTASGEWLPARVGTALATSDFALGGNWGTSPSVSAVTGIDLRFRVTVASGSGAPGASPTLTLTLKDGAFRAAPRAVVSRGDTSAPTTGVWAVTSTTTTTVVLTFIGTPAASTNYIADVMVAGV
jgi:hypothetical protein